MNEPHFYLTIESPGTAEFKDRGSVFIAYAYPLADVASFKEQLNNARKDHPKATHHCFAYRLGTDGNSFRSSDDGEPAGTAGKPILGQIDSKKLVNVLVIVVRYFGGTLLGLPGLINAYRSAAALALQMTPVVQKIKEQHLSIQFDYTQMGEVMAIVKQVNCRVVKKEIQLFCTMDVAVPVNRIDEIRYRFSGLRDVSITER